MTWTNDPLLESKLNGLGAQYALARNIPIAAIDVHGSRRNNARLRTEWNEDLSTEYGVAMDDGDAFPAIVLRRCGGEFSYFVLSGNHRLGAAILLKLSTIDAYVVEGDDELVFQSITRASNRWMGDRQSKDEAVEHAKELIAKFNRSHVEMAKLFGLNVKWLSASLRTEEIRDSLQQLGVRSEAMPRTTLQSLAAVADNDRILRKAGYLAATFCLSAERTREMVSVVKLERTEQDQIDALKRLEDQYQEERPVENQCAPAKRTPRSRFYQNLNAMANYINSGRGGRRFESLTQLGVTSASDRMEVRSRWRVLRKSMEELFHLDDVLNGKPNKSSKERV